MGDISAGTSRVGTANPDTAGRQEVDINAQPRVQGRQVQGAQAQGRLRREANIVDTKPTIGAKKFTGNPNGARIPYPEELLEIDEVGCKIDATDRASQKRPAVHTKFEYNRISKCVERVDDDGEFLTFAGEKLSDGTNLYNDDRVDIIANLVVSGDYLAQLDGEVLVSILKDDELVPYLFIVNARKGGTIKFVDDVEQGYNGNGDISVKRHHLDAAQRAGKATDLHQDLREIFGLKPLPVNPPVALPKDGLVDGQNAAQPELAEVDERDPLPAAPVLTPDKVGRLDPPSDPPSDRIAAVRNFWNDRVIKNPAAPSLPSLPSLP